MRLGRIALRATQTKELKEICCLQLFDRKKMITRSIIADFMTYRLCHIHKSPKINKIYKNLNINYKIGFSPFLLAPRRP